MRKGKEEMLSARKFAQRAQISYTTVMAWLRDELIPGARFVEESPHGAYWEIPVSSLDKVERPKRGPKPKTEGDQADEKPTKPAKKAKSKKRR